MQPRWACYYLLSILSADSRVEAKSSGLNSLAPVLVPILALGRCDPWPCEQAANDRRVRPILPRAQRVLRLVANATLDKVGSHDALVQQHRPSMPVTGLPRFTRRV